MTELDSLIHQSQRGNLEAYGTLVQRYQDMAVAVAYGYLGDFHLAEDAAQEAFMEAHTHLSQLRESKAWAAWLKRIVFKHCDRMTRRKRHPVVALEKAEWVTDTTAEPWEIAERHELSHQVNVQIQSLPDNERMVVALFYISGYSQKEIATLLEETPAQVNSRLQRARKRLKERMLTMVEDSLHENRPSKDNAFAEKVIEMIKAARRGDAEQVKALASADPKLMSATGAMPYAVAQAMQPIHMAISNGRFNVVKALIEQGADINAKDDRGRSALHVALQNGGRGKITELLLGNGAEPDLFCAIWLNNQQQVDDMLSQKPSLAKAVGPDGTTALNYVQSIDLAQRLLDLGADPNHLDSQKQPPLVWHGSNPELVALLLSNSATVDDIYTAAAIGDLDAVQRFVDSDPNAVHFTKAGWANRLIHGQPTTPLVPAMYHEHEDVVRFLLEQGASPNLRFFGEGFTLLHESVKVKNLTIMRLLLEHGGDPNIVDHVTHCTPIDWAFERTEIKDLLAEFGGKAAADL